MSLPKISNRRSRRIGERTRTEWLYAAEMETLRMITQGAGLTDILNHVCASIDRLISPSITTILLMDPDGLRLRPIAGPKGSQDASRRARRRKGADLARCVPRPRTEARDTRRLVAADLDQREPGPRDIRGLLSRVPRADGR